PVPAEPRKLTHHRTLLLSGGNIRYEKSGLNPDMTGESPKLAPHTLTLVWNERDGIGRSLDHYLNDPDGKNIGTQSSTLKVVLQFHAAVVPVLAVLRPGDERIDCCPKLAGYRVKQRRLKAGNAEYTVLERPDLRSIDGITDELWLDPSHGYRIVRMHGLSRDILAGKDRSAHYIRQTVEFDYAETTDGVWYPKSWTTTVVTRDGRYVLSEKAVCEEFRRPDRIDDASFVLEFPVGTWIQDADMAKSPTGGLFIQQEGGKRRSILPDEMR
ncbi:MAG: hypothetical protein D6815_08945, partial [Candidatus Dadabacteria bacterium]